jgi:hypothetical protein
MISVSGPNKDEYDQEIEEMLAAFGAKVKAILQPDFRPEPASDARELTSAGECADAVYGILTGENDGMSNPATRNEVAAEIERYAQARLASARGQEAQAPEQVDLWMDAGVPQPDSDEGGREKAKGVVSQNILTFDEWERAYEISQACDSPSITQGRKAAWDYATKLAALRKEKKHA